MAISGFDDASDKFTTRGGRDLIASRHHEGKKEGLLRSADHIAKFTIWQTTTASGHLEVGPSSPQTVDYSGKSGVCGWTEPDQRSREIE